MKRYVAAMIRDAKTEEGLTEENFKVRSVCTEQTDIVLCKRAGAGTGCT